LVLLAKADYLGQAPNKEQRVSFEAGDWLLAEAERMEVRDEAPRPLLKGRHLLAMGMSPGPEMGAFLRQAFEKQLNGDLQTKDDAISWAKSNLPTLFGIAR